MPIKDIQPGEPAPSFGLYEELNIFGSPTGRLAAMAKDEKLPEAARAFSWRPLTIRSSGELRSRAEQHRRLAETAQTAVVADKLRAIADQLDALADERGTHARREP